MAKYLVTLYLYGYVHKRFDGLLEDSKESFSGYIDEIQELLGSFVYFVDEISPTVIDQMVKDVYTQRIPNIQNVKYAAINQVVVLPPDNNVKSYKFK